MTLCNGYDTVSQSIQKCVNETNQSRSSQQRSSTSREGQDDEGAASLQRETRSTLMEYLSDNLQVKFSYIYFMENILLHMRINSCSTEINIKLFYL